MNQQQVEQWIAANGGPGAVQYTSGKKRLQNPAYGRTLPSGEDNPQWEPGAPQFIESDEEQWVNSKTGATLRVSRKTDGSFDVLENKGADPNKPGAAGDAAPPGGKPFIDDGPDAGTAGRRWGWNPATKAYDRDLGPSPAAQKPAEAKPIQTNTTEPYILTRMPDGSIKAEPNLNYKGPEQKPGSNIQVKGADGRIYLVPIDGQGKPGKPQLVDVPGEGPSTPRTAGPALPQIVLGNSQEALRTYKQQLQEGVAAGRWSQAWADARWGEAIQVAGMAVQEAATQQREAESTRNAEMTLATQKQNSMQTATSNALSFVNSINGSLPEGSPLGGQAFAALLGLQMLQANLSGISSIDPRARPQPLTPADLQNPQALAAKRDEIGAAVSAAAAPPPVRDDWRTQPSQPAQPAAPAAPARPVVPAPPPSSIVPNGTPNPGPVPGQDIVPELLPSQATPGGQTPVEAGMPTGSNILPQPDEEAPPGTPDPIDSAPAPAPYEETVTVRHRGFGGTKTITRAYWEQYKAQHPWASKMWVEGPADPGAPPAPTHLDPTVPYPSNVNPNSQVLPSEWQALQNVMPQPPAPQPQQPQMGMPQMGGEPPAMRRARIASSPPWRLSEDDITWAEQNGLGNEAWAIPGRGAA